MSDSPALPPPLGETGDRFPGRSRLRRRVLLPLLAVFMVVQGVLIVQIRGVQQRHLLSVASAPAEEGRRRLNDAQQLTVSVLESMGAEMLSRPAVIEHFRAREKDQLCAVLLEDFEPITEKLGITHLYAHLPDGTNLIRVHNPVCSGGRIDRWTLLEAMRTGERASGLESGVTGMFTLRSVLPVKIGGETIGYLELGMEFDRLMAQLSQPTLVTATKSTLHEPVVLGVASVRGRTLDWDRHEDVVALYCSFDPLRALFDRVADSGFEGGTHSPFGTSHTWITRDGERTVSLSGFELPDAAGHPGVTVYTSRDLTPTVAMMRSELWRVAASFAVLSGVVLLGGFVLLGSVERRLHEREVGLHEARETAHAASEAKTRFLANMSHELRTPMTAILGYSELLSHSSDFVWDRSRAMEAAESIRRNADHLLTVLNDVLDVSRIESGQMVLERVGLNLPELVCESVRLMGVQARGKGLVLRVEFDGPVPERVESDPTRIRQVLLNLVGNALKFTEVGGITVRVGTTDAGLVRFTVEDTGIGMSEDEVRSISRFQPFTQADASTTRRYGGTGLGLRICNDLTHRLGGELSVESALGRGSVVTFTIDPGADAGASTVTPPVFDATEDLRTHRLADSDSRTEPVLDGVRVLLVEDGPDNRRLVEFLLRRAHAEVHSVENGRLALDHLASCGVDRLPHVIVMDMQMPEMDGYEATRLLRERGDTTPIIALTAHSMAGDRERCLAAGCDRYLSKPINRAWLVGQVASLAQSAGPSSNAA